MTKDSTPLSNSELREETKTTIFAATKIGMRFHDYPDDAVLSKVLSYVDDIMESIEQVCNESRKEGELAGRSNELVKLSEWGKTIDDQWNSHFEERLSELTKESES